MLLHTLLLTCVLSNLLVPACARAASPADAAARASLSAYSSEAEFEGALERWRREAEKLQGERRRGQLNALQLAAAPSAAPAKAEAAVLAKSASMADAADSITNVQTAGVDEGGIVKRAGDHLVILRRGRLFTVRVGGDALQPAASIDAYAPRSDPQGAWYDELLISGSTVAVIGYSYARGGTEIGLFELGADGALAYRDTYHLRSFDYYSSRNYASRLIGRKLVFYTPTLLHASMPVAQDQMPALRRWREQATPADFRRILPATRIYRTNDEFDPRDALALHTVTSCDLDAQPLSCESTAVLGAAGRVFYVSGSAVYVWTSAWRRRGLPAPAAGASEGSGNGPAQRSLSAVFRLPLDGAAPSGIKTAGVPIDQLSFLEEGGHLDVLVRESGNGEGMWGSERSGGSLALLRVRWPRSATAAMRRSAPITARSRPPSAERSRTASSATGCSGASARAMRARRRRQIAAHRRPRGRCATPGPTQFSRSRRGMASSASRHSARMPCWSATPGRTCSSAASGSTRPARSSQDGTCRRTRARARRARTASSTGRPAPPTGCSACRCSKPAGPPATACSSRRKGRLRCCTCASAISRSARSDGWRRVPAARATTAARHRASTGTATPARSSSASACSRCSATSSSKAGSPDAAVPSASRTGAASASHRRR